MSGATVAASLTIFALALLFVGTNVSVGFEVAVAKNRSGLGWGLFSFVFPVVGPLLAYLLPAKQDRRRGAS